MDIELYRTFLAISDAGSFTAAARQVGRTQSAVSQQVKRLEAALGHPLFERHASGVELTEYGKTLTGLARDIVDGHSEVLATFNRTNFEGLIVIGVADAYVNRILREVGREFMNLYPQATLSIVIDDSAGLARRISEGSVDLAFVTDGNCPTSGSVAFRDRLVVVGPAAVDLSRADPLPLALWDERHRDETLLMNTLDSMSRRYRTAYVCRNVHAQHAAIQAGLCIAVLAEGSMVEGERAYLESDGFPVLREVTIRLERTAGKKSQVIDRLEAHFLDYFAEGRG